MQQWTRRYRQLTQAQPTLYKRARTRAYLFEGVETFGLSQAVEAIPALLHVAVFLFFAGLIDFLFSVDSMVGRVILGVMCLFSGTYIILTFLPNVRPNCPYRTPFSRESLKWFLVASTALVLLMIHSLQYVLHNHKIEMVRERFQNFVQSLRSTMSESVHSRQKEIDKNALQWAVMIVEDDDDIETLIEGIPGYLKTRTSKNAFSNVKDLLELNEPGYNPLGQHINRLIQTCTTDGYTGTNEKLRKRRALICLDTARILTAVHFASFSYEIFGDRTWPSVYSLERDDDPVIAINAISTGALAACAYLRLIFEPGPQTPDQMRTHMKNLGQLVNAPWHQADLDSFSGFHLLVLQGFVSSLLPHLKSGKVTPMNFRVVWETIPWMRTSIEQTMQRMLMTSRQLLS